MSFSGSSFSGGTFNGAQYYGAGLTVSARVWTPAQLFTAGEVGAWFDPTDITTLYQDSAGTVPITAAGQTVGRITDKSGRGFHATQTGSTTVRPTYQVDTNGVGYLDFDGVDDWLVTGTMTPTSDKMQIFTAIRKLSDAASKVVAEYGTTFTSFAGAFGLFAPLSNVSNSLAFQNRGTATATATAASAYPAPTKNLVVTGLGDIAGDRTTLRVDGAQIQQSTADLGVAATYNSLPVYIGRRGGTSFPYNGRIYGMILRFGPNLSSDLLARTEQWLNGKARAY